MLIQPAARGKSLNMEFRFENSLISSRENVNYLGINLDQHLNFNSHIEKVTKKIAKTSGIIWKLKYFS